MQKAHNQEHIQALIAQLSDHDKITRTHVRQELVDIGDASVPALIETLESDNTTIRWESCKALGQIADPQAAQALIRHLSDSEFAIRWLAAEALMDLDLAGVIAVLRALVHESPEDLWLREGAHHILRALRGSWYGEFLAPVIKALEQRDAAITVLTKAYKALEYIEVSERERTSR